MGEGGGVKDGREVSAASFTHCIFIGACYESIMACIVCEALHVARQVGDGRDLMVEWDSQLHLPLPGNGDHIVCSVGGRIQGEKLGLCNK